MCPPSALPNVTPETVKSLLPNLTVPAGGPYLSPSLLWGPRSTQRFSLSGPGPCAMERTTGTLKLFTWLVAASHGMPTCRAQGSRQEAEGKGTGRSGWKWAPLILTAAVPAGLRCLCWDWGPDLPPHPHRVCLHSRSFMASLPSVCPEHLGVSAPLDVGADTAHLPGHLPPPGHLLFREETGSRG